MARQHFLAWVVAGKPKHGPVFESMKLSRARFKYGLRFLKRHKTQLISNSLATKLQEGRPDRFWKEVNCMNNCKVPLPNSIDGVNGADNLTELWKGHFEQLFNCIHDNDITSLHYDVTYTNDILCTVDEIESVIGQLDKNKSCGLDGVYAEHLMYCSRRVLQLLAVCMSTCFVHGFLPDSCHYTKS